MANAELSRVQEPLAINDATNRIFVANDSKVSLLEPISFERQVPSCSARSTTLTREQITMLMSDARVTEALELARSTMFPAGHVLLAEEEAELKKASCDRTAEPRLTVPQKMNDIQVQAFWGLLSLRKFADAFELLCNTECDAREVRA